VSVHSTKAGARTALWLASLCALVPVVCLAIPMYVIRPFRPQAADQLGLALTVRSAAPWISAVCVIAMLIVALWGWRRIGSMLSRAALITLGVITIAGACMTHINIFEIMFHPYPSPHFVTANAVKVDADDKVLAIKIGSEAHAYPIRTMGYHHVVNDTVGGAPIAVTYCTLCHTGLVWSRILDRRTLHFRLAGINNGNALIRDEETSSIWQQSTGQSIFGPMKGRQLGLIRSDELTFSLWRAEQPQGLVLEPDPQYASEYDPKDWEQHIEKTKTVIDTRQSGIAPHELMLGVAFDGKNKAYPIKTILTAKLIQDDIGSDSVLILTGPDQSSIRVFRGQISSSPMTFASLPVSVHSAEAGIMQDAETASIWNFQGCAISGALKDQCLTRVDANKDYWFDWMNHHPGTAVFKS
jgi:Protein of unknown function (DUF3179)